MSKPYGFRKRFSFAASAAIGGVSEAMRHRYRIAASGALEWLVWTREPLLGAPLYLVVERVQENGRAVDSPFARVFEVDADTVQRLVDTRLQPDLAWPSLTGAPTEATTPANPEEAP